MFWQIVLYAFIAGVVGTTLGGVVAVLFRRPSRKFIGLCFGFSAAVLLTLAFVDLIPHGEEYAGIWFTILGVGIGICLIFVLRLFDKHGHEHMHGALPHNPECSHEDKSCQKRRMTTVAFIIVFAIILHDFPKGLAIGASGSVLIALAIGLAHIPEGIAIAMPLRAIGTKVWKILGLCVLAGLATMLGAMIGYAVGGISDVVAGLMFAVAAGCIIGVVFMEILPLSFEYAGKSKALIIVMAVGVLMMLALHYLLESLGV